MLQEHRIALNLLIFTIVQVHFINGLKPFVITLVHSLILIIEYLFLFLLEFAYLNGFSNVVDEVIPKTKEQDLGNNECEPDVKFEEIMMWIFLLIFVDVAKKVDKS